MHIIALDEIQELHTPSMHLPLPRTFRPELSNDRLATVARFLLEEHYATEDDLASTVDDTYTRGCATFGRQRNRILQEEAGKGHPWLTILNPGYDLVFGIGGIPCRFGRDNVDDPKKPAVLEANFHQQSLFESTEFNEPCRFVFVIDSGIPEEDVEPRVIFLGFDAAGVARCRWESDLIPTLRTVDYVVPKAVELDKPAVSPKAPERKEEQPPTKDRQADDM